MPAHPSLALLLPLVPLLPASASIAPIASTPVAVPTIPAAASASAGASAVAAAAPRPDDAEESYQFIVGLADSGHHDVLIREARDFLRRFDEHPKADQVRYRLATALFDTGDAKSARAEFRALADVRGFEFEAEVRFRLGQCELDLGAAAAAIEHFERVLALGTDYLASPASFLAGEAAFRAEDFARAEPHYQRVLEAGDSDYRADAGFGAAWCAYKRGEHERALRRIADFVKRHERDGAEAERVGELRFLAGECQLELERPKQALEEYRRVPEGPSRAGALRGAGFALAALERHGEAAASFRELYERHPESPFASEAALQAGIRALRAGDARAALGALESKLAPTGPETSFWRARCHATLGEHERALAVLDEALRDRSLRGDAQAELRTRLEVARGDALFELGRGDEAAESYGRAGSDYALHAAAVARLNDGAAEEALRLIQNVTAKESSAYRLEALLTQGEALFALERFDEALPSFEAVADESPDADTRARALARAGWCRFRTRGFEGAARAFERVAREHADSSFAPEAVFMCGRANEEAGAADAARTAYASYWEEHRGGVHAVEAGLRLARLEPGEAGVRRLEQLIDAAPNDELAPQVRYDLAERLAAEGRHGAADRHYRAIVEGAPEHALAAPAAYGLAWGLYAQERFEDCGQTLRALRARDGLDPELLTVALELSVYAERKLGHPDASREAFEAFAPRCHDEPRRLRAAKVCAAALREAGALAQAQRMFAALLQDTKEGEVAISICVERAYLALDQEDTDEAEKLLRAAQPYAERDADLTEAFFFAGEARFEAGEDEAALLDYGVAATSPTPEVAARALYKSGFANLRLERHAAAAEAFATLVAEHEQDPLVGEALFLCGEARVRGEEWAAAVAPLERLLREHPRHAVRPKALFRLGLAKAHLGEWSAAHDRLADLLKSEPEFPSRDEAELWRGRALVQLDRRRAARSAFQVVTSRDDGVLSARAHIELGKLARLEGDADSALSAYLKVSVLYAHEEEVGEALYLAGEILEEQGKAERAKAQYAELLERAPKCSHAKRARARLKALG